MRIRQAAKVPTARDLILTILLMTSLDAWVVAQAEDSQEELQRRNRQIIERLLKTMDRNQKTIKLGDMVFSVDQLKKAAKTSGGLRGRPWPNGLVYYSFQDDVDETLQDQFRNAFRLWETGTSVVFVERTTEVNHISITAATTNFSSVGMAGGRQTLAVTSNASTATILHELGHALVMHHEHQRSDRDNYVNIFRENIESGSLNNFDLITATFNYTPYDFHSIMHYSKAAFSKNGQHTIEPKPAYAEFLEQMGRQNTLSFGDRESIRKLYGLIPLLLFPEDEAEVPVPVEDTRITWSTVPGAIRYQFQVATDSSFVSALIDQTVDGTHDPFDGISTQSDSARNLVPVATHFWRVRALHSGGFAPWSEVSSFTSTTGPLAALLLVSPENGATLTSQMVTLVWQPIADADFYDLQVSETQDFSSLVHESSRRGEVSSQTVGPLAAGLTYYWRARARSPSGPGPWSETRSFAVDLATSAALLGTDIPRTYALHQNYPNPFNPVTTIQFDQPRPGVATLKIYDIRGRTIVTLVDGILPSGIHRFEWDASGSPSGLYFYRLVADTFSSTKKLTLVR